MWSRIANVFHADRLHREIDEELQSHIDEAIEQGRDPAEARRAFGSLLRQREETRDMRLVAWLDSLRADAIFGWRRLRKSKVTSAAAILSLALAIGACTAAFRLIDALLLRPLRIAHPERLYALSRHGVGLDGKPSSYDSWAGPVVHLMRAAANDQAELIEVSYWERSDLTYGSDEEMEKGYLQYVSGWMFGSFGLRPALGRLMTGDDDKSGARPVAVLSYDYWSRRFARDPKVIGRTLHQGSNLYEIIGVGPESFTGTETGTMVDVFFPAMMHPSANRKDSTPFRTLVLVNPGVPVEPLRQKLAAISRAFEEERAKGFTDMPKAKIASYLNEAISIDRAAAGSSNLQKDYMQPLMALGTLVALVLLIACANVANLMTAQATARAREMALRVSIGAGRWRLVQLVLVESAWIAILAAAIGAAFAWWAAPFVVRMINPPDNPARLALPADWRILAFASALTLGVTFLFGLVPALRASSVKPASALKGGEDPHSRRRLMHALIAAQVAFCFLVLFVAGLFVATFERLSHRPIGFSADRLLLLDTVTAHAQQPAYWNEVADRLRAVPGVETVALAGWPLLSGYQSNNFLSLNGGPPIEPLAFFLNVSPGWLETMKIPLIDGRDFRADDVDPGAVIVNETFVKTFFNGENAIGKSFYRTYPRRIPSTIVGVVRDSRYNGMRERTKPVAYLPFRRNDAKGDLQPTRSATIIVRTAGANPLTLASLLRREVPRIRSEFRVSNLHTQQELIDAQTVRERLLAMLALFFAAVALLLAGIGLYGVLNYSVVQRRREIGIRLAIGAPASGIARLVTVDVFSMVLAGALIGVAIGMASVRTVETLFYQVKATDAGMLLLPALSLFAAAVLASLPAVLQAVRIDPVNTLRSE
ncbi:MAG TPA: ABC transporter permease [Bryobacteraceae bacterium]|nr:ABC transporter permease [Bryobacteraceae bacterium]